MYGRSRPAGLNRAIKGGQRPHSHQLCRSSVLLLGFYNERKNRFGAPGDFAQAYVIAHEVGHHVQNLLGISEQVHDAQRQAPGQAGPLSIRLELQADCLAGVWAASTRRRDILEKGDIEEGLGAAAAVGDDRIQRQMTGRVSPETWTHGSSTQRAGWFKRGLESGDARDCDTFHTALPGIERDQPSFGSNTPDGS